MMKHLINGDDEIFVSNLENFRITLFHSIIIMDTDTQKGVNCMAVEGNYFV